MTEMTEKALTVSQSCRLQKNNGSLAKKSPSDMNPPSKQENAIQAISNDPGHRSACQISQVPVTFRDDLGDTPRPNTGESYSKLVARASDGRVSLNNCCADCNCFISLLSSDNKIPAPSFCLVICVSQHPMSTNVKHTVSTLLCHSNQPLEDNAAQTLFSCWTTAPHAE